jgi:serine/threonine protein kinase
MTLAPGSTVGKYRIKRLLGSGGMASVYVATHQTTEMDVALKVMSDLLRADEHASRRFLEEARTVSRVRHPGVVRVFDADRDATGLWMAMELLEGESLGARLQAGPPTMEDVADWFCQLLDVLAHVHEAGIVHRDLKPDNVFLEHLPSGATQVRLLDFGIAKLNDSRLGTHATRTGYPLGTLPYLSPEQAMESKSVDARSDIYSAGVILYECLSGRLPYPAETLGELVVKMHSRPPLPLPLATHPLARRMSEVAMTCIAKEPASRPASCAQVLALMIAPLTDDVHAESIACETSSEPMPSGSASRRSSASPEAATEDAPPESLVRRRGLVWLGGLAAACLLGVVVSLWLLGPARPPQQRPARPSSVAAETPGTPAPAPQDVKVDVTVRTDVRRGELWVDGENHGLANPRHWTFAVAPGSHELAIRANAKTLVSKTIVARAGQPLSVFLTAPDSAALPRLAKAKKKDENGEPATAEAETADSLSAAQLSEVVESNRPQLKRCYEGALRATGGRQEGPLKIGVSVTVGANGATQQVTTDGDELGDMHACIRSAVERWRYPPSSSELEFAFPLVFQQSP